MYTHLLYDTLLRAKVVPHSQGASAYTLAGIHLYGFYFGISNALQLILCKRQTHLVLELNLVFFV